MTSRLDRYLQQWSLYKKSLVFFLCINVFSVTMGIVLGVNYFTSKRDLGTRLQASLEKIESADAAIAHLHQFEAEFASRTRIEIRSVEDEKKILNLLGQWQKIKALAFEVTNIEVNPETSFLVASAQSLSEIQNIKNQMATVKIAELKHAKIEIEKYNDTTKLIIIAGAITLLFGIIAPTLILYLMGRALNHARREIQATALQFVKTWAETKAGFGEDAFKNIDFWLQILLLVSNHAAKMSSHPAIQITSEIVHIVRLELLKKSTNPSSAA